MAVEVPDFNRMHMIDVPHSQSASAAAVNKPLLLLLRFNSSFFFKGFVLEVIYFNTHVTEKKFQPPKV